MRWLFSPMRVLHVSVLPKKQESVGVSVSKHGRRQEKACKSTTSPIIETEISFGNNGE